MVKVPESTHFYKYQACGHLARLERILSRHDLYFPTAAQLNDPAECRPRIVTASLRNKVRFLMRTWRANHPDADLLRVAEESAKATEGTKQMGEAAYHEEMVKAFYEFSTKTRVFSMSKRWDHMGQWASYADRHTGYCLEFANSGVFEKAREVEYGARSSLT